MRLYLIRHGEIAGDSHRRYEPDEILTHCLSPRGCQQAEALSRALGDITFDHVFASPLGRALQTAQVLKRRENQPIVVHPWLIEWQPATVLTGCDETQYEQMLRRAGELPPEQCWKTDAGEGTLEMAHRVITGFLKLMDCLGVHAGHGGYLLDQVDDVRNIALVAHGGSLGSLAGFLLGVPIRPYAPIAMEQTGVAVFELVRRVDVWYPTLKIYPPTPSAMPVDSTSLLEKVKTDE